MKKPIRIQIDVDDFQPLKVTLMGVFLPLDEIPAAITTLRRLADTLESYQNRPLDIKEGVPTKVKEAEKEGVGG